MDGSVPLPMDSEYVCIASTAPTATGTTRGDSTRRSSLSHHVLVGNVNDLRTLHDHFDIDVELRGKNRTTTTVAMIDSGAQGCFVNPDFVRKHNIQQKPLKNPIRVGNIDGSSNSGGYITHYTILEVVVNGHVTLASFHTANIGTTDIILGIDWLRRYNPKCDWEQGVLSFPKCELCKGQTEPSEKSKSNSDCHNLCSRDTQTTYC
jgi:hypothetical protein